MKNACFLFISFLFLLLSIFTYQALLFFGYFKEIPLVHSDKCTFIPGLVGPEDIVIYNGIGLAGSDDRVKLWYSDSPIDNVPSGHIYAIYPGKLTFKQLKINNFPSDIAFHPHGMSLYKNLLYVISHAYGKGGERVEVLELKSVETEEKISIEYKYSLKFEGRYGSFNDLLVLNEKEFFITNWLSIPHTIEGPNRKSTFWLDIKRVLWTIFTKETFVHHCSINELNSPICRELTQTADEINNGIAFNGKDLILVAKCINEKVSLYRLTEGKDLVLLKDFNLNYIPDNIDYDPKTNSFYVAVTGRKLDFLKQEQIMLKYGNVTSSDDMKTGLFEIKVEENVEEMKANLLYMQNLLSGGSVGVKFDQGFIMGGPFVDGLAYCKNNN